MNKDQTKEEDSDSSDEDYIPEEKESKELPSEEDSDGEDEDYVLNDDDCVKSKRRKLIRKKPDDNKITQPKDAGPSQEETKKRTDALWADFMKDTGFKTKTTPTPTITESKPKVDSSQVKQVEIVRFAGEDVQVEVERANSQTSPTNSQPRKPNKSSNLGSMLNQLTKKRKITVLEKTKLDWEKYKSEEKLEDELVAYGKSKNGYLERQDFLQRADLRRFEIEKDMRKSLRSSSSNSK